MRNYELSIPCLLKRVLCHDMSWYVMCQSFLVSSQVGQSQSSRHSRFPESWHNEAAQRAPRCNMIKFCWKVDTPIERKMSKLCLLKASKIRPACHELSRQSQEFCQSFHFELSCLRTDPGKLMMKLMNTHSFYGSNVYKVGTKLRNHRLFSISVAKISVFVPPPFPLGTVSTFFRLPPSRFSIEVQLPPLRKWCAVPSSSQLFRLSPLVAGWALWLVLHVDIIDIHV